MNGRFVMGSEASMVFGSRIRRTRRSMPQVLETGGTACLIGNDALGAEGSGKLGEARYFAGGCTLVDNSPAGGIVDH